MPCLEELPWKRRDVERWVVDLLAQLTEVLTELFALKRAQADRDAAVDGMRARCALAPVRCAQHRPAVFPAASNTHFSREPPSRRPKP